MAERLSFSPPRGDTRQLLDAFYRNHPLADGLLAPLNDVDRIQQLVEADLAECLPGILREAQARNGEWAEGKLGDLRAESGEWSLDGILVNGEGRMVASPGYWSSFSAYRSGLDLPITVENLASIAVTNGELLFPLTSVRDSVFFWQYEFEDRVVPVLEGQLGEAVNAEDFPVRAELASQMPIRIRMARVRRDKVGAGKLAADDIILGTIGFWENPAFDPDKRYIPRVQIARSRLVDKTIYFSPLRPGFIAASGGLTMDEKHDVEIVRLNPDVAALDFVASAFVRGNERFDRQPYALRFNAYRPWFGERPNHS